VINGEFDLTPAELAEIFEEHNWEYATPTTSYGVPSEGDIFEMLLELVESVLASGYKNYFVSRGRFMAMKLEEFPNSTELYLHIGHIDDLDDDVTDPVEELLRSLGLLKEDM
jgi:hypothetical protein